MAAYRPPGGGDSVHLPDDRPVLRAPTTTSDSATSINRRELLIQGATALGMASLVGGVLWKRRSDAVAKLENHLVGGSSRILQSARLNSDIAVDGVAEEMRLYFL